MAEANAIGRIPRQVTRDRGIAEPGKRENSGLGQDLVVIRGAEPVQANEPLPEQAPAFEPAELIGRTIGGRYQLNSILGHGGLAAVYDATEKGTNLRLALKVLDHTASSEAAETQFSRELSALEMAFGTTNVLQFHGAGQDGVHRYFATEFLEGYVSLDNLLSQRRLSVREAFEVGVGAARGLADLHGRDLLHRDVKPGNIMIKMEGGEFVRLEGLPIVKLIDLGIALPPEETVSKEAVISGTLDHMPKEQLQNRPQTPASDIYALGATMYEMTSGGETPFDFMKMGEVRMQTYEGVPSHYFEKMPRQVQDIMRRSLAVDQNARQQSAESLIGEMQAYLQYEAAQYEAFNMAINGGVTEAVMSGSPRAGTIIYLSTNNMTPQFEDLANANFPSKEGFTVFRSDRMGMEGIFVHSRGNDAAAFSKKLHVMRNGADGNLGVAIQEIDAEARVTQELFNSDSPLVRQGRSARKGNATEVLKAGLATNEVNIKPEQEGATVEMKAPAPGERTVADKTKADLQAPSQPKQTQAQIAAAALASAFGKRLGAEIGKQLAQLEPEKLGKFEREFQAKVRAMSNQELANATGLDLEKARGIKTSLDRFEFGNLKTGFVALAINLLTMNGVSKLLSKVSPEMNPALNFALVLLGGHYTGEAIKVLSTRLRTKGFVAAVSELASLKSGKAFAGRWGGEVLAAAKVPGRTAAKLGLAAGRGLAGALKSAGAGKLTSAAWLLLMDGLGVKNKYLREGGSYGAFLVPDAAKLAGRYLLTVKGYKAFAQLATKGAIGTAARAANVVGWASLAADLTIGTAEHYIVNNKYDRSVLARAKAAWKDNENSTLERWGVSVANALVGSFMDAVTPDKYIEQVKKSDDEAVAAFLEELGRGAFVAELQGGSPEEVKGQLAEYIKQFVTQPNGKEYFENMQALIGIKYDRSMTRGQKILANLDISKPDKITVSDELLAALLVEGTFNGKYVKSQVRHARELMAAQSAIPNS